MSTIQLTNEQAWKKAAIVIVAALVAIYVISAVYPALGTYTFTPQTVIAVVVGTGLGAILVAHIKGNLLLEAFIGAITAFGGTAFIATLMGIGQTAVVALIFAGNFAAIIIVKGLMKRPL